jgi:transmembrane sensor
MPTHSSVADAIHDRAAYWVGRLNDHDFGDADREALHAWLLADPRHEAEFRAHNAVIGMAQDFPTDIRAHLEAYIPAAQHAHSPRRRRAWPAALAAALLTAAVAVGWFVSNPVGSSHLYTTRTGEVRTVTFEDGSVAYLNTRTKLQWVGNPRERRVRLGTGEALFDVVHDPNRPFLVELENSEILVLGTRFNVYRKPNGEVTVTVVEGKVAVKELGRRGTRPAWERELSANQRIVFRPLGLMHDVQEASAASATKWREGVLEIHDQPLPEVLDELTRYTDQRIVIRDPRLTELRVGGAVSIRDVRVALGRLEKLAPLHVVDSDGTFTIDYVDNATNNEDKRKN